MALALLLLAQTALVRMTLYCYEEGRFTAGHMRLTIEIMFVRVCGNRYERG